MFSKKLITHWFVLFVKKAIQHILKTYLKVYFFMLIWELDNHDR